jgi:hypothetical protein
MHHRIPALGLVIAVALALTAVAGPASGPARAGEGHAGPDAEAHAKACNHYANRARFRPRENADFITVLAETCATARADLAAPGPAPHATAFLDRLVRFTRLVGDMRMNRMRADVAATGGWGQGRVRGFGRVSETGEFLIAHRMGLLDAYRRFRAAAPDRVLALTD